MKQISDNQMLQYISKTAEMGIYGIKEVMPYAKGQRLRKDLMDQQQEYGEIYTQSRQMLRRRGSQPQNISRMAKWNTRMSVRANTMVNRSPGKIAEMMIKGNTLGVTKSIQHLNHYQGNNHQIRTLATKLLRTEQANIDSMKPFL